jgi:heme/copper-type cytochrome/quinol oxidase subunit 2
MEGNSAMWLGLVVVLALGGVLAQFVVNMRKRRGQHDKAQS